MLNRELLEQGLAGLPLYTYHFITPDDLEFADRIRWICELSRAWMWARLLSSLCSGRP